MDVITHYNMLIDEENDSYRDPPLLQSHMDKWDGKIFIDALKLSGSENVLEIGIGTGRLAAKTAPLCKALTGIDISPKTSERAKENLKAHSNIKYICADYMSYGFEEKYNVIYSSLTSMHFEDKHAFISKTSNLLKDSGIFCISIDKNQSEYIDMGTRKLRIYPDTTENIKAISEKCSLSFKAIHETEFAHILIFYKTNPEGEII